MEMINHFSHPHPLVLLNDQETGDESKKGACGAGCGEAIDDNGLSYGCGDCSYFLHKKCTDLPRKILHHPLHLQHPLVLHEKSPYPSDGFGCNLCRKGRGFTYHCASCQFDLDVGCATHPQLSSPNLKKHQHFSHDHPLVFVEDVDSTQNYHPCSECGDQREHFSHEHSLMFNDCIIEDGKSCDGCMQLISTAHYSCAICEFFLHKSCFELPKRRRHWTSKKPLTLKFYVVFSCSFCNFFGSGFCYEDGEFVERMCIRCYRIPDIVTTERHKHRLIFDNEYKEKCSGCGAKPYKWSRIGHFKFKCKICNGFALCYRCLTRPDTVEYKLDVHPMVLCTSPENHDPSQSYCDWCEEGKDPTRWFYHCADCDLPLDLNCALGVCPFVKLGKPFKYKGHEEHPVTFVKIKFNAPKCNECKRRCGDVSLQCTKPDCGYMVHWKWPCVKDRTTPILHED